MKCLNSLPDRRWRRQRPVFMHISHFTCPFPRYRVTRGVIHSNMLPYYDGVAGTQDFSLLSSHFNFLPLVPPRKSVTPASLNALGPGTISQRLTIPNFIESRCTAQMVECVARFAHPHPKCLQVGARVNICSQQFPSYVFVLLSFGLHQSTGVGGTALLVPGSRKTPFVSQPVA